MKDDHPRVGLVFWKLVHRRGWIRHEVRAIVDEHFVTRYWSFRYGGMWRYEIEPVYLWHLWMDDARFTAAAAREATAAWLKPRREG